MSRGRKSWGGGKGDESRVDDYRSYRNNFDNIDFSGHRKGHREKVVEEIPVKCVEKVITKKYLFLDDIRIPNDAYLWGESQTLKQASNVPCNRWDIVRSYDEFVTWLDKNGIPDVVSFDNDLFDITDDAYSTEEVTKQLMMKDWENFPIKTGAHCAQYLVNLCVAKNEPIPTHFVHTANDAARGIIKKILKNEQI